jgi:hypothetical protein
MKKQSIREATAIRKAKVHESPLRLPNDPKDVSLLIDEAERMNFLGNYWLNCKVPNQLAAMKCLEMGWAHALSAAWLRCKLNGELARAQDEKPQPK